MNETPTALLRRLMPFLLRHSQSVSPLLFVNKALGSAPPTIYVRQNLSPFSKLSHNAMVKIIQPDNHCILSFGFLWLKAIISAPQKQHNLSIVHTMNLLAG